MVMMMMMMNDKLGRVKCCVFPLQIKSGLVLCVAHIIILQVALNTWGILVFSLDTFPAWASSGPQHLLIADNVTFTSDKP